MMGYAIDMDGTIYKGGKVISGAIEFIEFLKADNIPFVFLTNNSSNTRKYYSDKLTRLGFEVDESHVLTSTIATARFIRENRNGKRTYVLATPEVTDELRSMGVNVVEDDPEIILLAFDRTITFDRINRAYHSIVGGAELIATHPDDLCPTENGYDVDIGPFIRLFESLTGKKATVIGKPNVLMLEMAAREMGLDTKNVVMVGDRIYTDMKMAHDSGNPSILVLSGEAKMKDLKGSDIVPTHILESVGDIPDLLRCSSIPKRPIG